MTVDLRGPLVAPSLLAADGARLAEQAALLVDAGARMFHVDVMDGRFVPPLALGPQVVSGLRGCGAHLEVHLMVERPEQTQIGEFAQAGADTIIVHHEATPHVDYALQAIREAGCLAGMAITPSTPVEVFREVEVDVALLMTVNPGWGGQSFLAASLDRLLRLREIVGPMVEIEVDGGIDPTTAAQAAAAGATRFVAGTAIFGSADPQAAFREIASVVGA